MKENNNYPEAKPYDGPEEGVNAIIIKAGKSNEIVKTNRYTSRKVLLIGFSLVIVAILVFIINKKSENSTQIVSNEMSIEDSIKAANAAMEVMMHAAAMQDSANRVSDFEVAVTNNYTFIKELEVDWREGVMVVPNGMFWSISMIYNYSDDPFRDKPASQNLCHRQVGKKSVQGVVGGGAFAGQQQSTTIDDYVYLTINDRDFYWDDLQTLYAGGKDFDMLKKFRIRNFGLQQGTTVCFPYRDNGGPPGYFTYIISQYLSNDSTVIQSNIDSNQTNRSGDNSESFTDNYVDSIRTLKIKIINDYFNALDNKVVETKNYFVDNVEQYCTKLNADINFIESDLISHYKEFKDEHHEIMQNSFYLSEDGNNKVSFTGHMTCYRESKSKYQTCDVDYEVIFNDKFKFVSFKEVKINNLKFSVDKPN